MKCENQRVATVAENLRDLARHLDDIAAGSRPTAEDLADAPFLIDWTPLLTPAHAPAIRGHVLGHSLIADGEMLRCDILAADPDLGWIRSWAGYYRLCRQAELPTSAGVRA